MRIEPLAPEEEAHYRAWLRETFGDMVADLPVCKIDGVPQIHKGKVFGTWDRIGLPDMTCTFGDIFPKGSSAGLPPTEHP